MIRAVKPSYWRWAKLIQFIPKEFQGILEDAAADIMPYLGGNTTLFLLQPLDTSFVQTTRLKLLLEQESAT